MLYASVATLCLVWFLFSFEHVQCRSTGQVNEYSGRSSPTRRCLQSCFLISRHQTCYDKCLGRNKEGDFNLNARIMRIPPHLTPSLKRRKRDTNGVSKKCFTCESNISMADCLKNSTDSECKELSRRIPADADLACIRVALSELGECNQEIVHYGEVCSPKNMCDEEKCEKDILRRVSKKCYTCESTKSWEDCLKNRKVFECKKRRLRRGAADHCSTVALPKQRIWNQQIVHFATFCSPKNMCDEEKCEKDILPRDKYNITKGRRCVN